MKNGFSVKSYKHERLKFVVRGKVAGKWQRKYFETHGEAKTYAQQQNTRLLNEGLRGTEFPAWLRLSAERAYEALLPWGKTIEDALHFYLAHLEKTKTSAPLQKAIDELIKVRSEGGRSDVYCLAHEVLLAGLRGQFTKNSTAHASIADIRS